MLISEAELKRSDVLPSYKLGSFTTMMSHSWKQIPVSVRRGERGVLVRELRTMSELVHPQLLLLMGHTARLELVFEPVVLGPLYTCIHTHGIQFSLEDVVLQVTEALLYLADRGVVHRAVSSHAVQVTTPARQVKLGMLEAAVRTGKCAARPPDPRLYSWLAPELLAGRTCLARVESDVYSLCCVIWELVHNKVPWADMTASEILAEVGERRSSLPLERKRMPVLVFRTLRQGLIWEVEGRDLELTEVRDMMTHSRKQKDGWEIPEAKYTRSLKDRPKDLLRQLKIPESQLGRVAKSAIQTDIRRYLEDSENSEDEIEIVSEKHQSVLRSHNSLPILERKESKETEESYQKNMTLPLISESRFAKTEAFHRTKFSRQPFSRQQVVKRQIRPTGLGFKTSTSVAESKTGQSSKKTAKETQVPAGLYLNLWRGNRVLEDGEQNTARLLEHRMEEKQGQEQQQQENGPISSVKNSVQYFQTLISQSESPNNEQFHSALETRQTEVDRMDTEQEDLYTTAVNSQSSFLQQSLLLLRPADRSSSSSASGKASSRALAESTPVSFLQRKQSCVKELSALDCSPLLAGKYPSAPRKSESQFRKVLSVSSSFSSPGVGGSQVDFAVSDNRQTTFTTALSQATMEESVANDYSNNSALYQTAEMATDNSDESMVGKVRSPPVVTFNSSVEENTISIVSLPSDSNTEVTDAPTEPEDIYNDDELHPNLNLDPNNLQLVTGSGERGPERSRDGEEEIYETADPIDLLQEPSDDQVDEGWDNHNQDQDSSGQNDNSDEDQNDGWGEPGYNELTSGEDLTKYESVIDESESAVTSYEDHSSEEKQPEEETVDAEISQDLTKYESVTEESVADTKEEEVSLKIVEESAKSNKSKKKKNKKNKATKKEDCQDESAMVNNESNSKTDETGLQSEMTEEVSREIRSSREERDWKEGDACVARWEEDDCWYEAVVDGVEAGHAVVTFTQYGNSAMCPVTDLRDKDTVIDDFGQIEEENPENSAAKVEANEEEDEWS